MFDFFWDVVETVNKKETLGFSLFGWEHLVWLAIFVAGAVTAALCYRKLNPKQRNTSKIIFVAVLAAFEIIRYVAIGAVGVPLVRYAPVQLCHICLYLVIIHCLLNECKVKHYIGNFLYLVGIPAGLSALLFPAWKSLPAFCNCSSLYSFITHSLFVIYIIAAITAGEIKRDARTIWVSVFSLILMALGVYAFDLHTGLNFMYLVKLSPSSPLVIFQGLGDYRIGYAVFLAGLILIMYGVPALINKLRNATH